MHSQNFQQFQNFQQQQLTQQQQQYYMQQFGMNAQKDQMKISSPSMLLINFKNCFPDMFDKQQEFPNYQQQALYYQQQQYLKQQQAQTPPPTLQTSPSPNLQQQQQQQQLLPDDFNRKIYGLGKIETYLKERDPEQAIFTLGLDLTNLGLNLNDIQDLHTNFCSPFSDQPTRKVHSQSYQIPPYYLKQTILKNDHFKKFSDETLFYIFYNVIEEKYQMNAVEELQSSSNIHYLLYQIQKRMKIQQKT